MSNSRPGSEPRSTDRPKTLRFRADVPDPQLKVPPRYEQAHGPLDMLIFLMLPFVVLSVLLLLNGDASLYFMTFLLCTFLWIPTVFMMLIAATRRMRDYRVRIAPTGPLCFEVPRAIITPLLFATAAVALGGFLGVFELLFTDQTFITSSRIGRFGTLSMLIFGAIGCVALIFSLRKSAGLFISRQGLLAQARLTSPVEVSWADLDQVELKVEQRGKTIQLRDAHGEVHKLKIMHLGSDPVVIAEVIEYFRTHPEDRDELDTPLDALALVADFDKPRGTGR